MSKFCNIVCTLSVLFLLACSGKKEKAIVWKYNKTISLNDVAPIGILTQGEFLWVSDVDHNQLLKINQIGKILEQFKDFERPMHIAIFQNKIYIPEYTTDKIWILDNGSRKQYPLKTKTDAIAGVAVQGDNIAFADFYNHRVVLQQADKQRIIGKEGHQDGELYYPTDVAIKDNLLYIADAYNNRVQVFDFNGNYVKMIAWNENIKVATGIEISDSQVIVADFEGNRILIYNHAGKLLQTLSDHFDKPADIAVNDSKMYVVNYAGKSITVFQNENSKLHKP